jgi:GTP pyrophosphokinase
VDFAYSVHTEVGHQCVGARVNGKIVPLRYRLKNGDIIEILTSAGHNPSRDWLALAVTNKARSKIRHYLNTAEKQQAVEIGKKHFERELKRYDLSARKVEAEKAEALAQELGRGGQAGRPLRRHRLRQGLDAPGAGAPRARGESWRRRPPREADPITDAVKRLLRVGEERITVKGSGDLLIYRAKCCNPIMGEPIVGYITRGKGVSVHSQNCPNVVNLMYDPERRIAVEWERGGEGAYEVRIAAQVEDRPGVLAADHGRAGLDEHGHPHRGGQDLRRPYRDHRPHPAHPGPEAPGEGGEVHSRGERRDRRRAPDRRTLGRAAGLVTTAACR